MVCSFIKNDTDHRYDPLVKGYLQLYAFDRGALYLHNNCQYDI